MMKDFSGLMKQAQQMQQKMQEAQERLGQLTVEGTAWGNLVKVTMTCQGDVKALKIDPSLVDPSDVEMLEDLIKAALQDARHKGQKLTEEEMQKVTGGMGLPGGMKLPF